MPHPSSDSSLVRDASLHLLGDHLLHGLTTGQLPPTLVEVGDHPDGLELGLLPLEGRHPSDLLLGHRCEPHIHAVGVLTSGYAHQLERSGQSRRSRVQVLSLVSRTGEHVHRLGSDDPALVTAGGERPEGALVDLLQRCLGVPTDPPPDPASVLWAIHWLAALAVAEPAPSTPEAALAHHPGGIGTDPAAFPRYWDWRRIRRRVAAGGIEVPGLAADDAGWLDDGAFARWWLARLPPLGGLRRRVAARLPASVTTWLAGVLDDAGLPVTSWPHAARASTNPPPGDP